jgi:hypothetical protein
MLRLYFNIFNTAPIHPDPIWFGETGLSSSQCDCLTLFSLAGEGISQCQYGGKHPKGDKETEGQ